MVDCYIISRLMVEFVEPESSSAGEGEKKIKHPSQLLILVGPRVST
jgi:hypothetical protein